MSQHSHASGLVYALQSGCDRWPWPWYVAWFAFCQQFTESLLDAGKITLLYQQQRSLQAPGRTLAGILESLFINGIAQFPEPLDHLLVALFPVCQLFIEQGCQQLFATQRKVGQQMQFLTVQVDR